jgi:hypothetical protein
MSRRFLFTVVLCILSLCLSLPCRAGLRGPGKYCGVVVFDRWDSCTLYSGVFLMYISEGEKEKLRRYSGLAVHTRYAGKRKIKLPKNHKLIDAFSGKVISQNTNYFEVDLKQNETGFWLLENPE